ncbi:MAG: hypothetical protein ACLFPQ_06305 [Candidatus Woesearchaeota archaeon]
MVNNNKRTVSKIIFMLFLMELFTLVIISEASAAPDYAVNPVKTQAEPSKDVLNPIWNYVNTTYDLDVTVGKDNYEDAFYEIRVFNPTNNSIRLDLSISFPNKPEEIQLRINGLEEELQVSFESDSTSQITYLNEYTLNPNSEMVFELDYRRLITPNYYNLGLWSIDYSYNVPARISYEEIPSSDGVNRYVDFYSRVYYTGEVKFDYLPEDMSCSGCRFNRDEKIAEISNQGWFSLGWNKPRVPIVSSIVYIGMIALGIFLIYRAKNKG